ncbi:MAG: dethiobiotin synthase [Acidobacteriota bacterium]
MSAALLHRYRHRSPRYWKPIQTGIEHDDDTAEVRRLAARGPGAVLAAGVRLPGRWSPHLAARLAGSTIDIDAVLAAASGAGATSLVVEGAGGVLVPLNPTELLVDFIGRSGLPVVVVARSTLGTINHTVLTIEALTRRAVPIAGVVMVGPPNADNRMAIEHYGGVRVLGELPPLEPLGPETLGDWADSALDVDGHLDGWLA